MRARAAGAGNVVSEPGLDLAVFAGTSRFRPVAFLGRGSKGFVHRVLDEETGTEVALKTLDARDPEQLYHLKQEFRVLAGITHPNLVELYELIVGPTVSFFTMELVDGVAFTAYARNRLNGGPGSRLTPSHGLSIQRFLETAEQLAIGVSALHSANRLHRDIKPPNILVTEDGRVVLLDFGLATTLAPDGAEMSSSPVGTLAYMAPEQAWGRPADRAADWYGVGVVFYEALTGRLPFEGAPAQILLGKVNSKPAPPATLFPGIPRELDALTMDLLEPDPTKRPPADAILDVLTRLRSGTRASPRPRSARLADSPFVGRNAELAKLRFVWGSIHPGSPAVAHVHGPSGIGKTELVRRFLASVEAEGGTVVLRGRCHPQESVPYKALDTVVDELSRLLLSLPESAQAEVVPRHAASLTRLFPVLARVPSLADWNALADEGEPYEVRRQGFAALRELLAGLANRQRVVLWIDDLQWGDLDSAALLRELLRPPDAPGLLLCLSYRSQVRDGLPLVGRLAAQFEDLPPEAVHEILVGPLDAGETRHLASLLCASQPDTERSAELIAMECEGSPFFLGQYARHLQLHGAPSRAGLADVIHERVEMLPPLARTVLELACVAGRALERSVLLDAAGTEERGRPVITRLEHERLLRTTTAERHEPEIETYHDRIREMIVAQLDEDHVVDCHRRIVEALQRLPEPDPEALYQHYAGARLPELAGRYAVQAADRAARALAFDRAADLYRRALELDPAAGEDAQLHRRLAEALANAGRGVEAGESFEAAAERVAQEPANGDDTNALRRRAAEQYLRSGHIDRGISLMRDVLSELGIPLPASRGRALFSSVFKRTRLILRGSRIPPRGASSARPAARLELDACWAATTGLLGVEPFFADDVGLRYCMDAITAGTRSDVVRSLGLEAIREACLGGAFFERRTERLLKTAEKIVREGGDPYDEAWLRYCAGASAYFEARWQTAVAECDASVTILRESCRGAAWEIVTGDSFALTALAHMGQLGTLSRRLPFSISDGDQRGDLYASTSLRMGIPGLLWLAQDRPDDAREMADAGIARWPNPGKFLVQHYLHFLSTGHADLYVGDVRRAWRRSCEAWPQLKDILRGVAVARVELRYLRGRAAVAAARHPTSSDAGWPAERLLREAALEARRLGRERLPSASPYANTIRAGIAHLGGRDDEACRLLSAAADGFRRADMELHRAAARYQRARLRSGEEGGRVQAEAEAWMRKQGIRQPDAMAETLVPGFRE